MNNNGMRYSKQRELILETLRGNPIHPTADVMYDMVKVKEPSISLGTVYRNLNQLADAGMILKIPVPDGKDHFDGTVEPHYHLYCRSCGNLVDFPENLTSKITAFIDELEESGGVCISYDEIRFGGVCKKCLENDTGKISEE